jgi:hypothetical protein
MAVQELSDWHDALPCSGGSATELSATGAWLEGSRPVMYTSLLLNQGGVCHLPYQTRGAG